MVARRYPGIRFKIPQGLCINLKCIVEESSFSTGK